MGRKKKTKNNEWKIVGIIFGIGLLILFFLSFLPVHENRYTIKEPYNAIEIYYEKVPETYYEEECEFKLIPREGVLGYIDRTLNAISNEDAGELIKECENIQKTRYVELKKTRTITKYKDVEKTERINFWEKILN